MSLTADWDKRYSHYAKHCDLCGAKDVGLGEYRVCEACGRDYCQSCQLLLNKKPSPPMRFNLCGRCPREAEVLIFLARWADVLNPLHDEARAEFRRLFGDNRLSTIHPERTVPCG